MSLDKYYSLIDEFPMLLLNNVGPLKIILDKSEIIAWQEDMRKTLLEEGSPIDWANIGIILDDPYFLLIRDLVEFPNGDRNGYSRLLPRSELFGRIGVIILPVYQGRVLLLKHFRHSTRQWHLEIPRGYGEIQNLSIDNARKELFEEVGSKPSEIISLGFYHPETGIESQITELFIAKIDSVGKPAVNEGIDSFVLVNIEKIEDMIVNGEITDGFTISAYVRAKLRGLL